MIFMILAESSFSFIIIHTFFCLMRGDAENVFFSAQVVFSFQLFIIHLSFSPHSTSANDNNYICSSSVKFYV